MKRGDTLRYASYYCDTVWGHTEIQREYENEGVIIDIFVSDASGERIFEVKNGGFIKESRVIS